MKKILLITLVLSIFNQVFPQHSITEVQYFGDIKNAIVREYVFPATVSYVETESEHYFAYADASMQVVNAQIPPSLFVRDIQIFDKYVYFCGFDNSGPTLGVWGWFNVNDLAAGNLVYHIFDNFTCQSLHSDTLHSLAVYIENSTTHVALVGAVTDGQATHRWCTIDVTGNPGYPTGWNYTIGVPMTPNLPNDRITKVCVTDKFVVTAGNLNPPAYCETIRAHWRGNMFMSGGPQDSIYLYSAFYDGLNRNNPVFAITHTTGDMVATVTKGTGTSYPSMTPRFGIVVNVYDIASLVTTPNPMPVYNMTADINSWNILNIITIRDIRYSNTQKELHLLLTGVPLNPSNGSIIAELPLPPVYTPGSFNYSFIPNRTMMSLSNYNSQNNTLAIGFDDNDNTKLNYFTQPLITTPVCSNQSSYYFTPTGYRAKSQWSPYTTAIAQFDCATSQQINLVIIPNGIICE